MHKEHMYSNALWERGNIEPNKNNKNQPDPIQPALVPYSSTSVKKQVLVDSEKNKPQRTQRAQRIKEMICFSMSSVVKKVSFGLWA